MMHELIKLLYHADVTGVTVLKVDTSLGLGASNSLNTDSHHAIHIQSGILTHISDSENHFPGLSDVLEVRRCNVR